MAAVVLTLSPGGASTPAVREPAAPAAEGVLNLTRFATGTVTFAGKLSVGVPATATLIVSNGGQAGVTVSCKARRSAGGQLALPSTTTVPAGGRGEVQITWTPSKGGEQKLSFDVCAPKLGKMPVQVFGTVVSAEIASRALPLPALHRQRWKEGLLPDCQHHTCAHT